MKKLLISLLFIIGTLFVVDRGVGHIMWYVNQHTHDISGPKLKYLADSVSEDIILLGTSRCNFHYIPAILADSLKMSVYNGGIDASNNIYAQYIVLNLILIHHTPKLICLELSSNDYETMGDDFKTTSFFAPYIGRSEKADSVFREAGNYWLYHISYLYRYNSKAISNLGGLFSNRQKGEDHGYLPLPKPKSHPKDLETVKLTGTIDTLKMHYLRRFIEICRHNNIILVFMTSPRYEKAPSNMYLPLKDVAIKYGIPYFEYHTRGLFLDHPEYFKDTAHLYDKSARIYTSIFAHDLKEYLVRKSIIN